MISWKLIPYFFRKLGQMSQSVSSAAVVIDALMVRFQFNWPNGFWDNMFYYIDWNLIWVSSAERSKVNLDLRDSFLVTCAASLTMYVKYNNFGFKSFQKSTFKNPFNCIRKQI